MADQNRDSNPGGSHKQGQPGEGSRQHENPGQQGQNPDQQKRPGYQDDRSMGQERSGNKEQRQGEKEDHKQGGQGGQNR
jgi:hypothetical protein